MRLQDAIAEFLALSWHFFTDITLPGYGFPIAVLWVGIFLVFLGLRVLSMALGLDYGSGGGSYGSAKGGKVKISKQREKDEK